MTNVVALYPYKALCDGDLSFEKGDLLDVLQKEDSDWWSCRHTRTGEQGVIPSNYVAEVVSLESKDWYFGSIKRFQAERELKSPGNDYGAYLIRDSESMPGGYSLSLLDNQNNDKVIKHYRIKTLDKGGFYIAPKCTFKTLDELITHYSSRIIRSDIFLSLIIPFFRQRGAIEAIKTSVSKGRTFPIRFR